MIAVGDRVLVTTDRWFYGADGREYRAVWGTVKAVCSDDETLGIRTNRNSTNWYAVIGNATVAGCQIHYVVRCESCPPLTSEIWNIHEGEAKVTVRPTCVYNADVTV